MNKLIIFIIPFLINSNLKCTDSNNWDGPDFLIIGTMKGGTTSLYKYLTQHPQILGANYKEIHFFDIHYKKGLDWYKNQFPTKVDNKLIGESSPLYLYHPLVPKRVYDIFPKTKLIILLRDPVDRLISHYFMLNKDKLSLDVGEVVEREKIAQDELHKLMLNGSCNIHKLIHNSYLSRGMYIDQINRWQSYFPKNQIFVVFSEDLFKQTEKTVNEIFKFLNLPEYKLQDYSSHNKAKVKRIVSPEDKKKLYELYTQANIDLENYLNLKLPWNKKLE